MAYCKLLINIALLKVIYIFYEAFPHAGGLLSLSKIYQIRRYTESGRTRLIIILKILSSCAYLNATNSINNIFLSNPK
jgi:hypothetical protein